MSAQPGKPANGDQQDGRGGKARPSFAAGASGPATAVPAQPTGTPGPGSPGPLPGSPGSRVRRAPGPGPLVTGPPALGDTEARRELPRPAAAPVLDKAALDEAAPDETAMDEPLLGDADALRARWRRAQASFVDSPRQAVADAADLTEQSAEAFVGALRQRQRQLRGMWDSGQDPAAGGGGPEARSYDTEHLRLIMQRYRALFDQIARP